MTNGSHGGHQPPLVHTDDHPSGVFARAMAENLTPSIIQEGRSALTLLSNGYSRKVVEAHIDDAEALVLAAGRAA